jgi:hypothetical protein
MKNLWTRGSVQVGLWLCALLVGMGSSASGQPFTTVINVPPDPAPGGIGSDTQLNLFDGGSLPFGFTLAGTLFGLNSNIEANILGGTVGSGVLVGVAAGFGTNSDVTLNIGGGVVGDGLSVSTGGTVNISGGTVGERLEIESGGVVNMSGGVLGDFATPRNGSTFNLSGGSIGDFFEPRNNTTINISGGTIGENFSAGFNTTISISGGVFPGINILGGGTLNLSGGNFDSFFWPSDEVNITGSEFRFNGVPIAGLESAGDSIVFAAAESGLLTTTFADGAVLAFSPGGILSGTLTLNAVAAPVKPAAINLPSDPAPLGLREGQTLNLSTGAVLVDYFTAVDSALNINGGGVGRGLKVYGTSVDISGGSVGQYFSARSGSTVNISGGVVELGMRLSDSTATITGGTVGGSLRVESGSSLNLNGGTIGTYFRSFSGSTIGLQGSDLRLDGVPVPGLETPGLAVDLNLPEGSILTGRLADGSVFVFSSQSGDEIADGTLRFTAATVPLAGPGVIDVPGAPEPNGLWVGQVLNLSGGGELGDNFAAVDATVNITGGTVGQSLEVVNSSVTITGGEVGPNFVVLDGSQININGGVVGDFLNALSGSVVNIRGGEVGDRFMAGMPDGSSTDVTINMSGGTIGRVPQFFSGATANISGGVIGNQLFANAGSTINLIGRSFILDGVDITSTLTVEELFAIIDRDVVLEGVLADGSPFSFELNSRFSGNSDNFDTTATLTVTLVPEPGTVALLGVGGLMVMRRRRRG